MSPSASKLTPEQIFAVVKDNYADLIESEAVQGGDAWLTLKPSAAKDAARFTEFMTFCRDDSRLRFDLLSCISGVDYPDRGVIEVVYMLDSTVHNHWLVAKIAVPRGKVPQDAALLGEGGEDDSATPEPVGEVPTVENIWRTADWHERETYDLLGVRFRGHHHLVRILCAEDWVGHALRKDYVIPDEYHGIKNVIY